MSNLKKKYTYFNWFQLAAWKEAIDVLLLVQKHVSAVTPGQKTITLFMLFFSIYIITLDFNLDYQNVIKVQTLGFSKPLH